MNYKLSNTIQLLKREERYLKNMLIKRYIRLCIQADTKRVHIICYIHVCILGHNMNMLKNTLLMGLNVPLLHVALQDLQGGGETQQ